MTGPSAFIIKRLGLAILGRAALQTPPLFMILRGIKKLLILIIIQGLLISALLLLGCFGLYTFLKLQGLSILSATLLIAGLLSLLILISYFLTDLYIDRIEQIKKKPDRNILGFTSKEDSLLSQVGDVVEAFMEGFHNKDHIARRDNSNRLPYRHR